MKRFLLQNDSLINFSYVADVLGRLLDLLHRRVLFGHSRRLGAVLLARKGDLYITNNNL